MRGQRRRRDAATQPDVLGPAGCCAPGCALPDLHRPAFCIPAAGTSCTPVPLMPASTLPRFPCLGRRWSAGYRSAPPRWRSLPAIVSHTHALLRLSLPCTSKDQSSIPAESQLPGQSRRVPSSRVYTPAPQASHPAGGRQQRCAASASTTCQPPTTSTGFPAASRAACAWRG